jgi:hypothetical protein
VVAAGRHRAERRRSRTRLLLVSLAALAALASGGAATALWPGNQQQPAADPEYVSPLDATEEPSAIDPSTRAQAEERTSRNDVRSVLSGEAPAGAAHRASRVATEQKFLTEDLNVWTGPGDDTTLLMVLDEGSEIRATGRVVDGWAEIVQDGKLRWVNAEYLSNEEPKDESGGNGGSGGDGGSDGSGGLSDEACASGSEVEDGLVANAIAVHRAVCAEFPEITTYLGLRPGDDGFHGTGQALDIMITDSATGDAIAEFVQDNHAALGVSEIIWAQHIWTVDRSSEGWRWMEDRGSATANHYDHVHVSVY